MVKRKRSEEGVVESNLELNAERATAQSEEATRPSTGPLGREHVEIRASPRASSQGTSSEPVPVATPNWERRLKPSGPYWPLQGTQYDRLLGSHCRGYIDRLAVETNCPTS